MKTKSIITIVFILANTVLASCQPRQEPYRLEQITIISRHNVRAPLEKNIKEAKQNVADEKMLMSFSAPGSNQTQRGGALEMLMGEYFRMWLREEGLLVDCVKEIKKGKETVRDIVPDTTGFRFAASPRERTIASARAFVAGMLPAAEVSISHSEIDSRDSRYLPYLVDRSPCPALEIDKRFNIEGFIEEAKKEKRVIEDKYKSRLEEACRILERAVDFPHSANGGNFHHFFQKTINVDFSFYKDSIIQEPAADKYLKAANQLSDALILQYYEHPYPGSTGLHIHNEEDWHTIASIKDIYSKLLFAEPIVAVNTSHGLLTEIWKGIQDKDVKLNFICTHDTSITALLEALQAEPYELPGFTTLEGLTPVGCKLLFEKYNHKGEYYGRVRLVYQTTEQIRHMTVLDHQLGTDPASFPIRFKDMKAVGKEGQYYRWCDLECRMRQTLESFKKVAQGKKPF